MSKNGDLSKLHPLTRFCGDIGSLLFSMFGMMYLLSVFTSLPAFSIFLKISLFGLGLFVLGLLTIVIQVRLNPELQSN